MPEGRGSRIGSEISELRSEAGGFATRNPLADVPELRPAGFVSRNPPKRPDRLRTAADLLDQAAAADDKAAGQFAEARVDSTPFGLSAQARELAARWSAALAAREADARVLGDATSDLAGRLRMAAESTRSTGFRGRIAVAP
ncbi:hypothetical protein Amsp01_019880 [Amycolatopsis sp. NBRC 101858]|uniref:hypothetical protein n=1 Tax=Amycolatopsis sp. NBRC 101858 TaxID=3032200 RepID=UPI0024A0EB96|nr:hypothetical protein [Amycolatopsis sp. NBRC 101858]GLY35964.1 hypothetical protein Amsp01_019880 [Amycolatopsis sp. NBRC 101858]